MTKNMLDRKRVNLTNQLAQKVAYFAQKILLRNHMLALNAPIATKVVCFSRLLKCLRSLYGKQCGPRSDWSTLFASILNLSVILGNYLQQTSSEAFFSWHFKG